MSSPSTPRLRLTHAWYALLLALVAISARDSLGETGGAIARLAGFVLIVAAVLGRLWTSVHIAGYKDERLVTTGPYSLCRHPLYALSLLGGAGVGLATRSPLLLLLTVVVLLLMLYSAIRAEEKALSAAHGAKYEGYCRRVPRLVPRRSAGEATSATTEVKPAILWKAFLDAGSFLLIYVAIELLDLMHRAGWLPEWIRL